MATQQQIEAVAQAIRNTVANQSGRGRSWKSLPPKLRADYCAEASAAIAAYELTECNTITYPQPIDIG